MEKCHNQSPEKSRPKSTTKSRPVSSKAPPNGVSWSHVRPNSAKLPWGTILKPEYVSTTQHMAAYDMQQTMRNLYFVPQRNQGPIYTRIQEIYPKGCSRLNETDARLLMAKLWTQHNDRPSLKQLPQ